MGKINPGSTGEERIGRLEEETHPASLLVYRSISGINQYATWLRLISDYHDDFQRRTAALSGNRLLISSPEEVGGGIAFVFDFAR